MTNKLIIECNIKNSLDFANHKIKWYKDDFEIRPSYVSSGGMPTTYEQELDETTGKLKLLITYPTNADCGLYRCCISNRNNEKIDETSHLVYKIFNPLPLTSYEELEMGDKKQRVVFESFLSDVTAEEGNRSIKLNCKISQCNAQSEIKWFKSNEELSVDDQRDKYRFTKSYNRLCLEIMNPNQSDSGTYECHVKNQYSDISSKCNVHVYERIDKHRARTTPKGNVILSNLHFFKYAIQIHIIIHFAFTDTSFADTLSDISSGYEDTNRFLLEKSTRDIAARICRSPIHTLIDSGTSLARPTFATTISDRTITENSSSVKFTCSVLSTECDISWEKNGIPLRPSTKYRQTFTDGLAILEIFDVTDDDAGKYSCIASNKNGESVTSAKLKVYSGFKPTTSVPPTITRQMKGRKLMMQFIKVMIYKKENTALYRPYQNIISHLYTQPIFYFYVS